MTKMIALLLSILLFVIPVFAEEIDFSAMTDADLTALYEDIVSEMGERNLPMSDRLPIGVYIVGEDIKPGKYILKHDSEELKDDSVRVCIYDDVDKFENKKISYDYCEYYVDFFEEIMIQLEEGMVLEINRTPVTISTFSHSFWTIG